MCVDERVNHNSNHSLFGWVLMLIHDPLEIWLHRDWMKFFPPVFCVLFLLQFTVQLVDFGSFFWHRVYRTSRRALHGSECSGTLDPHLGRLNIPLVSPAFCSMWYTLYDTCIYIVICKYCRIIIYFHLFMWPIFMSGTWCRNPSHHQYHA